MKKTQLLKEKVCNVSDVSQVNMPFYFCVLMLIALCVQAMAEESGDGEKVKTLQDQLNELEERAEALDRQRTKNISAIRSEILIIIRVKYKCCLVCICRVSAGS